MDREEIIAALKGMNAAAFLEERLFDRVPHMFADNRALYVGWKRQLAEKLDVDPASVTIVGSAALGFSMNPGNNFRQFNEKSDVDVAVVSNYHFTVAWRYLRSNSTRMFSVDQRTQIAWQEHVRRYIYWGTIATDRLLGILPFGMAWMASTTAMALVDPTNGRDINLRIYADYESLRAYQTMSVKAVKESLFE